jgi:glucan 1,3-beta-glucosidase
VCHRFQTEPVVVLPQNGLDNSGDTGRYTWIGNLTSSGAAIYEHWLQRGGDWAGTYNPSTQSYETINSDGILDSLKVVNAIIDRYASHPAVAGIEPSKFLERYYCVVVSAVFME